MINIKNVLLVAMTSCCLVSFSQRHPKKKIILPKLECAIPELEKSLIANIENEKQCEYYSCKLIFTVGVSRTDFDSGDSSILVESLLDKNIALLLKPSGYFYKKGHLFLVDGDAYETLFINTTKEKEFKYVVYNNSLKNPDNGKEVVHYFTDDSFSQWEYKYSNGTLVLVNNSSRCD